jgi:DNA-binding NarL/FixJ family response regulator
MKILLVEDHPLLRQGVKLVLARVDAEAELVDAPDARTALALTAEQLDWDLVMLDLGLPDNDGLALLRTLRGRLPSTPIVVLSASEEPEVIHEALGAGAFGYVPKSSSNETLFNALRLVLAGTPYVPPQALLSMERDERPLAANVHVTPRQRDVLDLLAQGRSNKQIARELGLTPGTVRIHMTAIFKALQASNRTEAVFVARRLGLLADGN